MMLQRRSIALVALALSLAACGSTVAPSAQRAASQDGLSGAQGPTDPGSTTGLVSGPASTAGASGPGSNSAVAGGAGPQVQSRGGVATSAPTTTTTFGGAAGAKVPATGAVQVGFLVTKCSNCSALGAAYVAPTHSEQDILQALVNEQNKRGGLLGHRIVPVFGVEDTASSDISTEMQSICSTFTQDHHVIAVLGAGVTFQSILASCLQKAGVIAFDATRSTGIPDDQDLATYPGYVVTGEPSANAYSLVALTSAVADGWVTKKSVLGLLDFDCPEVARTYKKTVGPYIAAQGLNLKIHSTLSCPAGAGDLGSAAQGVQSAELKMHSNGVDTVIITDIPLVVFAEDAESQHWNPRYVASEGGAMYTPYLTTDQLKNIHSAGWEPTFDVDSQHQPALTPSQKDCLKKLSNGGLTGVNSSEYTVYFGMCADFDLYNLASAKAQSIAPADVLRGTEQLGRAFVSPMLLGGSTLLAPGKHTAPVEYRSLSFDTPCSCFTYKGPVRQLPKT